MLRLEGDYLFAASVDEVWDALFDPRILAAVMPGCEKLELVDGRYVGELHIKVGPVQGQFTGKVDLKDLDRPSSYTMLVDGRGAPGFVKASAQVKLEAEGAGTRIRYAADAQVGGKIASVGQRLIEASARAIVKQSLDGLNGNIKLRTEAHRAASAAARASAPAETAAEAEVAPPPHMAEPVAAATAAAPLEAAPPPATTTASLGPEAAAGPVVVLKQIDQRALAASIAKEVARALIPTPVVVVLILGVVALVVWLGFTR